MNKSIKNFVNFLEEIYQKLESKKRKAVFDNVRQIDNKLVITLNSISPETMHDVDELQTEIGNIIRMINTPDEELALKKEVFDDFTILSSYIEMANLNVADIYQVITFFIERNIKSCIEEDAITIDMNILKNLTFKTMDINALLAKISRGEINDFMNKEYDELTEEERSQVDELNARLPEFTRSLKDISKYNKNYDKYIFNKMPNILLEDILEAKIALRELRCSDYVIERVIVYLLNVYEKNLKNSNEELDEELNQVYVNVLFPVHKDKNDEIIRDDSYYKNMYHTRLIKDHNEALRAKNRPVQKSEPVKKYLTEDDVRVLKKFIRRFYDLYNIELRETPNYGELIQLIDYMEKLELDSNEIKRYLTKLLESCTLGDNFISTEEELLHVLNKLITYKVPAKEVDFFIRKYRKNIIKSYANAVEEYLDRIEEIKFYDASAASDMSELYQELANANEEDSQIIVSMLQEYLSMLSKYNLSVSYEYDLARKLK